MHRHRSDDFDTDRHIASTVRYSLTAIDTRSVIVYRRSSILLRDGSIGIALPSNSCSGKHSRQFSNRLPNILCRVGNIQNNRVIIVSIRGRHSNSDVFSLRRSAPDRWLITRQDHGQATAIDCLQQDLMYAN